MNPRRRRHNKRARYLRIERSFHVFVNGVNDSNGVYRLYRKDVWGHLRPCNLRKDCHCESCVHLKGAS